MTHDQLEAMTLGDRVAVLKDGLLQQVDTPQRLFQHPANLLVAAFIGSPSMNLVEAKVTGHSLSFAGFELPGPAGSGLAAFDGRTVILGIRPSDFEDADVWHRDGLPVIEVTPEVTEDLGSERHVIFSVDAPPVVTPDTQAATVTEEVEELVPLGDGGASFVARVDSRSRCRPGAAVRLSVDPANFHFFDPASGRAIGRGERQPDG